MTFFSSGHASGPDSLERREALKSADNVIKHLLDEARKQNMRDQVYSTLKGANIKGLNVFKREELPELYHLKNTYLTQPIVLTADPGYQIKKVSFIGQSYGSTPQENCIYSSHSDESRITHS
ncbi:hypothetical protein HPB48_004012 [Haemaphysalis longicornis]|uniref:Uncharacterized protein n=1 Tax=Haemaphysalis longicornis TaxID=44386 RepID=A0A9J6FYJ2_HAELO|nr:hypothetical protein HPB48_004012 [Haemaphysalis longicornis]